LTKHQNSFKFAMKAENLAYTHALLQRVYTIWVSHIMLGSTSKFTSKWFSFYCW